jgi:hypothetical protein
MNEMHKDIFFKGLFWLEENEYTALIKFDENLESKKVWEAQNIISKQITEKRKEIQKDYTDDEYTLSEYDDKIDVLEMYIVWNNKNKYNIQPYVNQMEIVLFEAFKNKMKYDYSIDEAIDKEFDKMMIDFVKSVTNKIYQ